jgi:cytochrome c-type biogenesis protein CcmH/NrfF
MISPAPRDGVFILWTLPAPDVVALRAVVAEVRRREAERRARRSAGSAGK